MVTFTAEQHAKIDEVRKIFSAVLTATEPKKSLAMRIYKDGSGELNLIPDCLDLFVSENTIHGFSKISELPENPFLTITDFVTYWWRLAATPYGSIFEMFQQPFGVVVKLDYMNEPSDVYIITDTIEDIFTDWYRSPIQDLHVYVSHKLATYKLR